MKIYLCKNTKNVDKIEKFLEQNLRKVTIEIKSCIGMCKYCGSNVVAKVDGKEIVADSAFGLLKEIRKILKKEDKLELIKEAKMKGSKKDVKLIKSESDKEKAKDKALELAKEKAKDKDKAKDKEKAKEKAKDKEKAKEKAKDKEKAKEKAIKLRIKQKKK